jgi:hypothetical protein
MVTSAPAGNGIGAIHEEFDPSSDWPGAGTEISLMTQYETTPKKTLVEYRKSDGQARYKTINTETGAEIVDYPNPTFPLRVDDVNLKAKDNFDTVYDVEIVE